jgi:hypothetical protein
MALLPGRDIQNQFNNCTEHEHTRRKSIIVGADNNFDLLRLVNGYPTIDSISFRGGHAAIFVSTGDVSDVTITIMRCDFPGQVFASIATDGNRGSTAIHVHDCHFYMGGTTTSPGGNVLNAKTGDSIVFRDCWIGAAIGNDAFVLGDPQNYLPVGAKGTELQLHNLAGGPGEGGAWIKIWSGGLDCHHCRSGGEGGGKVIVENFSPSSKIYIWDTAAFAVDGPHYMLHRIPALFKVHDSNGDGHGIWLDPAIPPADIEALGISKFFEFDGSQYRALLNRILPGSCLNINSLTTTPRTAPASVAAIQGVIHSPEMRTIRTIRAEQLLMQISTVADPESTYLGLATFSDGDVSVNGNPAGLYGVPLVSVEADPRGGACAVFIGFNQALQTLMKSPH